MKITKIATRTMAIPLKRPFKTALRVAEAIEDILVRVETDAGLTGLGEAGPTAVITGDTKQSIQGAIEDFIAPALIGRELEDFDGLMEALHCALLKNHSAKAAVDMALYDLLAQSYGVPLYQWLGGRKKRVITDITISLNETPEMVADSLDALCDSFSILKIKVGKDGLDDAKRVAEIRKAIGPGAELRVDANQGWTPKESVRNIRAMEDMGCDIALVEQPVPAHDLAGLRFVTASVLTPILADESIFSLLDAEEVIRTRAADCINIKLMKTGGIYQALKICGLAESHGVACMMGCMLESRLSVSAAAHLAAAKGIISMADLDGPSLCAADPYEGGPVFRGPDIFMPEEPGIGIKLKPDLSFKEASF
ncbi:MAG: dipeptide epimerase [Clostridiales bacterium]|jgi:o-succinylbenzoate synthase|nr:dipeptide epimerase [Clostridiales bacterium]